jgi:hypothetical protein
VFADRVPIVQLNQINFGKSLIGWGITQKFSDTSKLSIVAAFDIYTQTPVEASDRAYSAFLQHSRYSPKYPDHANFWSPQGVFSDAAGNIYAVKPGTAGPNITANDFLINDGFTSNFDTKFQQIVPRETRYGGSVDLDYDATSWLRFYDSFIIQRNEELSVTPNQGYGGTGNLTIPANSPFNPFGVQLTSAGFNALYELGPWRTDTTIRTLRNTWRTNYPTSARLVCGRKTLSEFPTSSLWRVYSTPSYYLGWILFEPG